MGASASCRDSKAATASAGTAAGFDVEVARDQERMDGLLGVGQFADIGHGDIGEMGEWNDSVERARLHNPLQVVDGAGQACQALQRLEFRRG